MKRFVGEKIFGISIRQEYVCIGLESLTHPLSAYITGIESSPRFRVRHDLLLGYKPLVMGISCDKFSEQARWLGNQEKVCFSLVRDEFQSDLKWKGFISDKGAVARLILKRIGVRELGGSSIVIFEGEWGEHAFLPPLHQATNRLKEKLLGKKG